MDALHGPSEQPRQSKLTAGSCRMCCTNRDTLSLACSCTAKWGRVTAYTTLHNLMSACQHERHPSLLPNSACCSSFVFSEVQTHSIIDENRPSAHKLALCQQT